ncbi:hypothetical protein [Streptomyces sp. NPDC050738]|uniref:hypothetical protein n=1 Tax=Streptomyces sp. NPDC050738 TaxID=3154744 RepID=UPI0034460363
MRKLVQVLALASLTAATTLVFNGAAEAATVSPASVSNKCTETVKIRASASTSATIKGYCYTYSTVTSACYNVGTTVFGNPYWDKVHVVTPKQCMDCTPTTTDGWISEYYLSNKNAVHC